MTELPVAGDVVARLEEIARVPLPPEATDVTDRVDEVEELVAGRLRDDERLRRELITACETHPDPRVRGWLDGLVTPSVHLAVAEPERLHDQPGVPVTAEQTPSYAALTLGPRSTEHLGRRERRRALRQPWTATSTWFHGEPQRSTALADWPVVDGVPVPFWLQLDLAHAEDNVAPYEFSRVGLPADGVLQVFADPWAVADGEPVPHRVVLVPADTLRHEALPRPRGLEPVADTRLATTDTMATLPHEDDVPDTEAWGPGERFDYRVLKQLLERDPYLRNAQVPFAGDAGTPVRSDYRPVVPPARLGGHPLPPRRLLEPALAALGAGVSAADVFVVLDGPLGEAEPLALEPDRPRLVILARRADVAGGDLSATVALRYFGPGQPLPYDETAPPPPT